MHILTGLHDPRVNPVDVLRDTWKAALDPWFDALSFQSTRCINYGRDKGYGIGLVRDTPGAPVTEQTSVGFGYADGRNYFYPMVTLLNGGEFRFNFRPRGWSQRDVVARNTFLTWQTVGKEFVWRVGEGEGAYTSPTWTNPVHYVGEQAFHLKSHGGSPWLKLERAGQEWTIAYSRPFQQRHIDGVVRADMERYAKLRARRYRLWERQHLIETGQLDPKDRSRLTPEQRRERFNAAATLLQGHMPATVRKTTPMKKEPT